ncbi:MAG: LPS assembly lipoprotein LptE [Rhodospirillales bacterium]
MSLFRLLSFFAAVIAIGACGFQPMYGQRAGNTATEDLAAIEIKPISGRIGQYLHNQLLDRLNPRERPVNPEYVLRVTLVESVTRLAVRKSALATRANLVLNANFILYGARSEKMNSLFSGKSEVTSSYNIFDSDFATLMAEKEARNRAAIEISNNIRARLTVFLQQRKASQGPPGK